MRTLNLFVLSALVAAPAFAQDVAIAATENTDTAKAEAEAPKKEKKVSQTQLVKRIEIQNLRPTDKRGINMFETVKATEQVPFDGVKLSFGAAFSQTF